MVAGRRVDAGIPIVPDGMKVKASLLIEKKEGGYFSKVIERRFVKNLVVTQGLKNMKNDLSWGEDVEFACVDVADEALDKLIPSQIVLGDDGTAPVAGDTGLKGNDLGFSVTDPTGVISYAIGGYPTQYPGIALGQGTYGVDFWDFSAADLVKIVKHFPSNSEVSQSASDLINSTTIKEAGLFSPRAATERVRGVAGAAAYEGMIGLLSTMWQQTGTPWTGEVTIGSHVHRVFRLFDFTAGAQHYLWRQAHATYWSWDMSLTNFNRIRWLNGPTGTYNMFALWIAQSYPSVFGAADMRMYARAAFTGITKSTTQSLTVAWILKFAPA